MKTERVIDLDYPAYGVYRHFKGNYYKLLYVAKDSETLEEKAVYKALYGEGGVWVRPLAMFTETVERDGVTMPRFQYICRDESELKLLKKQDELPGDKIRMWFFGTGSGTQPRAGRHHVSFAVEMQNGVYWFDAGECGSYMAHIMGLDLLRIRSIFISHCHMDHVGGLGNLLWNIRKLTQGKNAKGLPVGGNVDVFVPAKSTYDGLMQLLSNTEGGFRCDYTHTYHSVNEGLIYESSSDDFRVYAKPNTHLDDGTSFSYIIKAGSKTIVFSGDFNFTDMSYIMPEDGCDLFMCETGHNKPLDICERIKADKMNVKRLFLFHNGPRVMDDIEGTEKILRENFSGEWRICEDATTYIF